MSNNMDQRIVIIGCGRLGASIANTFSDVNRNVVVLDKKKEAFQRLSSGFGGLIIVGDGMDLQVLKELELHRASAVIVVTNDDNTNIMISQLVHFVFHAKHIISRLYDVNRKSVYEQLQIATFCPVLLSFDTIDLWMKENTI